MRYTGPRGKAFSGDKAKAMSLQRAADLLVGRVIQRLKAPPFNGRGHLVDRQRMDDGSWVNALVSMQHGLVPVVRTWIESPIFNAASTEPSVGIAGPLVFISDCIEYAGSWSRRNTPSYYGVFRSTDMQDLKKLFVGIGSPRDSEFGYAVSLVEPAIEDRLRPYAISYVLRDSDGTPTYKIYNNIVLKDKNNIYYFVTDYSQCSTAGGAITISVQKNTFRVTVGGDPNYSTTAEDFVIPYQATKNAYHTYIATLQYDRWIRIGVYNGDTRLYWLNVRSNLYPVHAFGLAVQGIFPWDKGLYIVVCNTTSTSESAQLFKIRTVGVSDPVVDWVIRIPNTWIGQFDQLPFYPWAYAATSADFFICTSYSPANGTITVLFYSAYSGELLYSFVPEITNNGGRPFADKMAISGMLYYKDHLFLGVHQGGGYASEIDFSKAKIQVFAPDEVGQFPKNLVHEISGDHLRSVLGASANSACIGFVQDFFASHTKPESPFFAQQGIDYGYSYFGD